MVTLLVCLLAAVAAARNLCGAPYGPQLPQALTIARPITIPHTSCAVAVPWGISRATNSIPRTLQLRVRRICDHNRRRLSGVIA